MILQWLALASFLLFPILWRRGFSALRSYNITALVFGIIGVLIAITQDPRWYAIVMFDFFLTLILSGYPVAFSFAGTGILFGAIGIATGLFPFSRLILLQNR